METATWNAPEHIEEYRLVRQLGEGAMGRVFLAQDELLDRLVALKLILETTRDPHAHERFLNEARAVARLHHPNIVPIFRVGSHEGQPFLVSQYVRGQTLDQIPRPLPSRRVLRIGLGLARGLATAHRHGVLHRDIKLANVMLSEEDGEAKLVDFGLAKLVGQARPRIVPDDDSPFIEHTPFAPHVSHTGDGSVLGTPLYLAPELWLGDPATARSDVYALGVTLFMLASGQPPHVAKDAETLGQQVISSPPPRLLDLAPEVDRSFAAVIDRCLSPDPARRYASGEELREALEELAPSATGGSIPEGNPYRGLEAFRAEHRGLFFGRDREIRAIVERLRAERFVLVAGDSGVGKSSLCHAGVVPRLEAEISGREAVASLVIVPGRWPAFALATALAPLLECDPEPLLHRLRSDVRAVAAELRARLRSGLRPRLLLFVDQLEEISTLCAPEEAALFASTVSQLLALTPDLSLLATVRADFLARVARLPGLGDDIGRALYVLQPLTREGIRDAIALPARAHGVELEPEALDALVEGGHGEGLLPLLQFALAELWEARDPSTKSIALDAIARSGGVGGALARHADRVIAALAPAHREAVRQVATRLVTAERTRARRTEEELGLDDPNMARAVEALVRGRLLTVRQADSGSTYEIAHEALISRWDTMRQWLEDEADHRHIRERLAHAAGEWDRLARSKDALWGDRQLRDATRVEPSRLPAREAAFLGASRRAAKLRRVARTVMLLAIPLTAALAYGGFELAAHRELDAQVSARVAQAQAPLGRARSSSRLLEERREAAFERFIAGNSEDGERDWNITLQLTTSVERSYGRAMQLLESALLLDPHREDVRSLFATVLYDRLLIADRAGHGDLRDELLERLRVHDTGRTLLERWSEPGELEVTSNPSGAAVVMIETSSSGASVERQLGATPLSVPQLSPGSYTLELRAQGHVPVRAAVKLERGEKVALPLELPRRDRLPANFVYVPAGRFSFGSSNDDGLRRHFLNTTPLHPRRTDAFLIGRHEVTFGEWIEYLEALPHDERDKRTPKTASRGFNGSLALGREGNTWRLTFRVTEKSYSALAGEKIVYSGRTRQAEQDWLRFPVSAISFDDAQAYAAWLDASGRLPGARLCSELEWERAARGADSREYPHGDRLDPADASYDETHGKVPSAFGPDEAGSHPRSASPFGVHDLAGNVWEWTRSALAPGKGVARGGSFYHDKLGARSTNRLTPEPSLRDLTLGLRICATWTDPTAQQNAE